MDSTMNSPHERQQQQQQPRRLPQTTSTGVTSPGGSSPTASRRNLPNVPYTSTTEYNTPAPIGNTPFLHPLQTHRVRATRKALIDVDVITGRKLINQYEVIEEIGSGMHCKVKLARNLETGDNVAIKVIARFSKKRRLGKVTASSPQDKIKKEIAILKKIRHPNVVALLEVIDDPELKKIYMVLEHVELGEIVWRKKGLPHICQYERRLVERDMGGPAPWDEEIQYNEHLERRQAIKALKRAKRAKMAQNFPGPSDYWSVEHGAVDKGSSVGHGSRISPREDFEITDSPSSLSGSRRSSPAPSRSMSIASTDLIPPEFAEDISWVDDAETQGRLHSAPRSTAALDAYAEDSPRDEPPERSPGMAESITSHTSSVDYNPYTHDLFAEDYSFVPCFTFEQARSTFRDTVLGLEYLHYQGIVHRDIKPANLLWTRDQRVKISDLAVSYVGRPNRDAERDGTVCEAKDFDDDLELSRTVGTPAFLAPELCYTDINNPTHAKVSEQMDVWSLGVTLYCLIFARIPFLAEDEFQLFRKIATEEVHIPRRRLKPVDPSTSPAEHSLYQRQNAHPYRDDNDLDHEDVDNQLYDLLRQMLTKNPETRIRLRDIKRHPWVVQGISNVVDWLDSTDPARHSRGGKIQVDENEMSYAVVPLTFLERARLTMKEVVGKVMHPLRESKSRGRAASSVAGSAEDILLKHAGAPTFERRPSLRGSAYFAKVDEDGQGGANHLTTTTSTAVVQTDSTHNVVAMGLEPVKEDEDRHRRTYARNEGKHDQTSFPLAVSTHGEAAGKKALYLLDKTVTLAPENFHGSNIEFASNRHEPVARLLEKVVKIEDRPNSSLPSLRDSGYETATRGQMSIGRSYGDDDGGTDCSEIRSLTTSDIEDYASKIANDLIDKVASDDGQGQLRRSLDDLDKKRIAGKLTQLLKTFALKVGHCSYDGVGTQTNRDVMVFVYKNIDRITNLFIEKYSLPEVSSSQHRSNCDSDRDDSERDDSPGMSLEEKFQRWSTNDTEVATIPPDDSNESADVDHFSHLDNDSNIQSVNDETQRLHTYHEFLSKSVAYQWLIAQLRQGLGLAPAEPDIMTEISKTILSSLRPRRVSRTFSLQTYTVAFEVDWDPHAFIREQEHEEESGEAIGLTLTLTGSAENVQALDCKKYLTQTWPSTGEKTLQLVKDIVRSESGVKHKCLLADNTKLTAWTEASKLLVEASEVGYSLAEFGEQLAWLGAALRSPPVSDGPATVYCEPSILQADSEKSLSRRPNIFWKLNFNLRTVRKSLNPPNGQCWLNLFESPVVVEGYPISIRPEHGTGLDIPLNVAAELMQARCASIFDGRVFIKGFCAMIVLAKHLGDILIWHLLCNQDESRVSYLDSRISSIPADNIENIDLSDLGTSRHVIGWCSDAKNYTGELDADYAIGLSELQRPNRGCRFHNVRISKGQLMLPGNILIPKKARHNRDHPYFDRLRWISKRFVVMYDVNGKRAWLVNATSALLHLVRASLEVERADQNFNEFYRFVAVEPDATKKTPIERALAVLINEKNRKQKLWEESAVHFEDKVDEIWCTLELILELQTKINRRGGTFGNFLEGFEFMDVARSMEKEVTDILPGLKPFDIGNCTWIDLVRNLDAVTLFGTQFGQLLKPVDPKRLCSAWVEVPGGKNYLAVHLADIKTILDRRPYPTAKPRQLFDDVHWHIPDKLFRACKCERNDASGCCDIVQVLVREQIVDRLEDERFENLARSATCGAVILGQDLECSLYSEDKPFINSFGSNQGSSTTWANENFVTSGSTWSQSEASSGYTKSSPCSANLLGSLLPHPVTEPVVHETAPEGKLNNEIVTNIDPQTSHRLSKYNINKSNLWGHFNLYLLAGVLLALISRSFYWTITSISVLATWTYRITIFSKKYNRGKSSSPLPLVKGDCYTIWAFRLSRWIGLLFLLTWCALLSPLHILTPTLLDAWTTYSDHPPLESFNILYDPGQTGVVADVFAIHGLGSNYSSAWRHRGNGTDVCWLQDILPKQTKFKHIRITILNHQTRWDSHVPDVDFEMHAKMLLDDIEHVNQGNRPIIFIAHSFGGLLLKKALVLAITQSKQVAQMTRGILFLGVPHYGTKAVFIASLLSCTAYWRGSSTTLLDYMSEGNPAVKDLDDAFYNIYVRRSSTVGIRPPYICNFLEMRPERLGKLSFGPTVNAKAGGLRYAEDVLLDTDHRGLNKFRSSEDPNYKKFLRHFTKAFLHE